MRRDRRPRLSGPGAVRRAALLLCLGSLGACGGATGPELAEALELELALGQAHLGLLVELQKFQYDSADFFHASLSGTHTKLKFFSESTMELNWGSGAVLYGYSVGSILLGEPQFQGGDSPPDEEVDKDIQAALRLEAQGVPIGGRPVSGLASLVLEGTPSVPVELPVSLAQRPDGTLVLRAGEGDHEIAEGASMEAMRAPDG